MAIGEMAGRPDSPGPGLAARRGAGPRPRAVSGPVSESRASLWQSGPSLGSVWALRQSDCGTGTGQAQLDRWRLPESLPASLLAGAQGPAAGPAGPGRANARDRDRLTCTSDWRYS